MPGAIVGAVGSVAGGIASGKGAKKAAQIAAQTADKDRAQAKAFYDDSVNRYQGDISRGDQYSAGIQNLLGYGSDPAAQQNAFKQFQDSTGYNYQLQQGLGAINSNAYASGLGNSGATQQALQDRGQQMANGSFQQYLGNLVGQQAVGGNAKAALSGAGQVNLNAQNAANNSQGNAAANSALVQGQSWNNTLNSLGQIAGGALGKSSYQAAPKLSYDTTGF